MPAFARQLGVSCAACHTVEPQLTSFGRQFKSLAYTFNSGSNNTIGYEQDNQKRLAIDKIPPIALMLVADQVQESKQAPAGYNSTATAYTTGAAVSNPATEFPVQYSLFYAGRAGTDLGVFSQLTYDPTADHITIDNTDVRYAKESQVGGGNLVWGLDVNNAPGVGDLWQSTPIWGYPFTGPNAGQGGPNDGTLLGQVVLQQTSAGAGAYVWYNNTWYAQVMAYRAMIPGDQTNSGGLAGVAPYWRLAYSHEGGVNSWEIGTFGIDAKMYQNGNTGPENHYVDTALDGQYEHVATNYSYTFHASYIHENMTIPGAPNTKADVNDFQVNGEYYWHRKYGVLAQYFTHTGKKNAAVWGGGDQYGVAQSDGVSANGKPNTNGYVLQFNYVPWINTKFGVQYVAYTKFDGASSNYDGLGRNASDNNTLSFFTWIMM
ncbi:hypothetical protein Thpro_021566 [Acidihalobacter prosperus]|uniref:Cytochrome C n=1 Tax=Acidihalobacter prosperus TaxID=160660 RepID=A0A1A6C3V2_9GAMM|nr:hypothetical protein Thpro_021566 [Acidihalobacter prosperus]